MSVNFLILTKNVKFGIIWKKIIVSQFYYQVSLFDSIFIGNIDFRLETWLEFRNILCFQTTKFVACH